MSTHKKDIKLLRELARTRIELSEEDQSILQSIFPDVPRRVDLNLVLACIIPFLVRETGEKDLLKAFEKCSKSPRLEQKLNERIRRISTKLS